MRNSPHAPNRVLHTGERVVIAGGTGRVWGDTVFTVTAETDERLTLRADDGRETTAPRWACDAVTA